MIVTIAYGITTILENLVYNVEDQFIHFANEMEILFDRYNLANGNNEMSD